MINIHVIIACLKTDAFNDSTRGFYKIINQQFYQTWGAVMMIIMIIIKKKKKKKCVRNSDIQIFYPVTEISVIHVRLEHQGRSHSMV